MLDNTLLEWVKDVDARVRVLERKSDLRVAVVSGITSIIVALVATLLS